MISVLKECPWYNRLSGNYKTIITAITTIMTGRGCGCGYLASTIEERITAKKTPHFFIELLKCHYEK